VVLNAKSDVYASKECERIGFDWPQLGKVKYPNVDPLLAKQRLST
jgi:hypothetical protein